MLKNLIDNCDSSECQVVEYYNSQSLLIVIIFNTFAEVNAIGFTSGMRQYDMAAIASKSKNVFLAFLYNNIIFREYIKKTN